MDLLDDIAHFKYRDFYVQQPALILQGDDDEIFKLDTELEDEISSAFKDLKSMHYPSGNHEWCVFEPKEAAKQIKAFHERNKLKSSDQKTQ